MDLDSLLRLVAALGGTGTVAALYRWAKAQGRAEEVAAQVHKTLAAKDAEIAELHAENARLWQLLEHLTEPGGEA